MAKHPARHAGLLLLASVLWLAAPSFVVPRRLAATAAVAPALGLLLPAPAANAELSPPLQRAVTRYAAQLQSAMDFLYFVAWQSFGSPAQTHYLESPPFKNGVMTPLFWVMTPFLRGQGDSRYSLPFPEGALVPNEVLNDPFLPPKSHPREVLGPSGFVGAPAKTRYKSFRGAVLSNPL